MCRVWLHRGLAGLAVAACLLAQPTHTHATPLRPIRYDLEDVGCLCGSLVLVAELASHLLLGLNLSLATISIVIFVATRWRPHLRLNSDTLAWYYYPPGIRSRFRFCRCVHSMRFTTGSAAQRRQRAPDACRVHTWQRLSHDNGRRRGRGEFDTRRHRRRAVARRVVAASAAVAARRRRRPRRARHAWRRGRGGLDVRRLHRRYVARAVAAAVAAVAVQWHRRSCRARLARRRSRGGLCARLLRRCDAATALELPPLPPQTALLDDVYIPSCPPHQAALLRRARRSPPNLSAPLSC